MNKNIIKNIANIITAMVCCTITAYAQPTASYNYVISNSMLQPGITTQAQIDALAVTGRTQAVNYFDGLGRPFQSVLTQANPAQKDIITPIEYDAYGREIKKYLPYADVSGTVYSSIRTTAYADQGNFYNPATTTNSIAKDINPYAQSFLEFSPASRPLEGGAPGQTWQPGNGHTVKPLSLLNTITDDVKRWTVSYAANATWGGYTVAGAYGANELVKTITADEHGKQVIEFKDREGKVLLKKVQLDAAADNGSGSGYPGWLCTQYIYDDFNNLRCVIQPEAVKALPGNGWLINPTLLSEQCFRYEYDARKRMIMKKVPGAGEVYMVYDTRDRLVMTQDANLRLANKWMATIYNDENKPLLTGLLLNTGVSNKTFATHLSDAYNSTAYPFTYATQPAATYWEMLTETHYDDYANAGGGLTGSFINTYVTATNFITTYNTSPYFAQAQAQSLQTRGLPTWKQVKVLGTPTYLYTLMIYDDKGRVIQVKANNITGGTDIATSQYDFAGRLLRSHMAYQKNAGSTDIYQLLTKNEYDHGGRLLSVKKTVWSNTIAAVEKTILQNTYDELGQLKIKKLGANPANTANPLETLTYDYNIRGWLLGANRDYAKDANSTNYFGFDLGYEKTNNSIINNQTYTNPQYNGNIEGMVWKSRGDGEKRKYDFVYDAANRLSKADFTQYNGAAFAVSPVFDFSIGGDIASDGKMKYDANGNIMEMWQKGLKTTSSDWIDKLAYNYQTGSNKLAKVTDAGAATNNGKLGDFKDGTNTATDDYSYDVNGNLNLDNNKAISGITYNHLNLPATITVTGKGSITYTYDALGNKIKKQTLESPTTANGNKTITTTTTYIGGMVYESKTIAPADASNPNYTDRLQFIGHEEGRIRLRTTDNTLQYDYMLKDHLGNVRMVLTEEQQTNIYPAATLEGTFNATGTIQVNSMINYEKQFYKIDNTKVVAETSITTWPTETVANTKLYYNHNGNPPANTNYPAGCTPVQTAGSAKVYQLNATANKTGLEFMIKVMAGDKIDIFGKSYFVNTAALTNSNTTLDLVTLMTNLLTSPGNPAAGKGFSATDLTNLNTGQIPNTFFRGSNGEVSTIPKAYINYIFFDDQFKFAGGNFSRVGTSGTVKDHWYADGQLQNIVAPKNGYIFVYVSNESNVNVFFDNLQVIHKPGPILEETHYYPFGLRMEGICSKVANSLTNKYQYSGKEIQSKEFSDGSGLELYDFGARNYDPQIGRWHNPDPMADKWNSYSPYNYAVNNPINVIDPDGKDAVYAYDEETKTLTISAKIYYQGKGISKDKEARAKLMEGINKDLKETYKDGTVKVGDVEYTVKFDVTAAINDDVKQEDLKAGENIMTVDTDSKGLLQPDGTKRENVQGGKSNMGYLKSAGTRIDVHEIGHMLGFKDRYTDYENSKNNSNWRSLPHDGYQKDLMYDEKQPLNQSHYDDAVKYTLYKLNQGQKHLLPQFRSNTINVTANFDSSTPSSVAPADVPTGWQPRGAVIKK
jgi:RHS repeat-associated protein